MTREVVIQECMGVAQVSQVPRREPAGRIFPYNLNGRTLLIADPIYEQRIKESKIKKCYTR